MSINTAEIPQIEGDLEAVDSAGQSLKSAGKGFAETGSDVHSTWQGLSGVYRAPESGELLSATSPVSSDASTVGSDVKTVGSALTAYAAEVRPIKAELERLRTEAAAFNSSIEGDDDWNKDEDKVNEKNNILKAVNAAVAAWQAAERTCANAINATYGGVQYREDDGEGEPSAEEYGYSAEMLDGATAGDEGVPWGKASEVDKPWYEDVVDGVVSFGKGLVVDGLWGAVRGLGTMVGVDGWDAAKQAWAGVGKLALALNPVTAVIDQTVGLPGMERGEAGATALAAGKALIAYDMWGQDPARAAGAVTGNVLAAVVGTKGAGAAVKATGTAVKGASATGRAGSVVGRGLEGIGQVGIRASELSTRLTSSFTTKAGSLASRLQLPTFGPQPALAGAGAGGRAASAAFDVTPAPTRTGGPASQTAAFAARLDDNAPGGSRSSGTGTQPGTTSGSRGVAPTSIPDGESPSTSRAAGAAADGDGVRPGADPASSRAGAAAHAADTQQAAGSRAATGIDDAAAGADDLRSGPETQPQHSDRLAAGQGSIETNQRQPFEYGGRKTDPGARGLLGDHLTRAQAGLDNKEILGSQVRVYESSSSKTYSVADYLMRNEDSFLNFTETKTGNSPLTGKQELIYPKTVGDGPVIGSRTDDVVVTKGHELRRGDIASVQLERWDIDNLPTDLRDTLKGHSVSDVLEGRAGAAAQNDLASWMRENLDVKVIAEAAKVNP